MTKRSGKLRRRCCVTAAFFHQSRRKSTHNLLSQLTTPVCLFIVILVHVLIVGSSLIEKSGSQEGYTNLDHGSDSDFESTQNYTESQNFRRTINLQRKNQNNNLLGNLLRGQRGLFFKKSRPINPIEVNIPDYCGPYNKHEYNPYWLFQGLTTSDSETKCCLSQNQIKPGLQQAYALPFYNGITESELGYFLLTPRYYLNANTQTNPVTVTIFNKNSGKSGKVETHPFRKVFPCLCNPKRWNVTNARNFCKNWFCRQEAVDSERQGFELDLVGITEDFLPSGIYDLRNGSENTNNELRPVQTIKVDPNNRKNTENTVELLNTKKSLKSAPFPPTLSTLLLTSRLHTPTNSKMNSTNERFLFASYFYNSTWRGIMNEQFGLYCRQVAQHHLLGSEQYSEENLFNVTKFSCFTHYMCRDYFNRTVLQDRCEVFLEEDTLTCFYPVKYFQNIELPCPEFVVDSDYHDSDIPTLHYIKQGPNVTFGRHTCLRKRKIYDFKLGTPEKTIDPLNPHTFNKLDLSTYTDFTYHWDFLDPDTNELKPPNEPGAIHFNICATKDALDTNDEESNLDSLYIFVAGRSISIICLVASIFIWTMRSLRCLRNKLHINLAAAFILRDFTFLISTVMQFVMPDVHDEIGGGHGEENENSVNLTEVANNFTENSNSNSESNAQIILCSFLWTVHNYAITACFFWMFAEGLNIYLICFHVYEAQKLHHCIYYFIGWLLPGFPILIWAILKMNKNGANRCWVDNMHDRSDGAGDLGEVSSVSVGGKDGRSKEDRRSIDYGNSYEDKAYDSANYEIEYYDYEDYAKNSRKIHNYANSTMDSNFNNSTSLYNSTDSTPTTVFSPSSASSFDFENPFKNPDNIYRYPIYLVLILNFIVLLRVVHILAKKLKEASLSREERQQTKVVKAGLTLVQNVHK